MNQLDLRSPSDKVGGLVYFGRMLDKIRVHARGELPAEYQENLGRGFDEFCAAFLCVDYHELAEQVRQDSSDEDLLDWCFRRRGRPPTNVEIYVWNEFMRKRGWNDEISETLTRRKQKAGLSERADIVTMFQFIDADENRSPGSKTQ